MISVMPAQAGIQLTVAVSGLFASLTLRAARWAFNALRAFVRHSPE